ncbi:MAG: hypothetical protein K1X92_16810 [Bacteroidia bacterium]|nr:hypothetical protein [Bacteroidia bacterium]
MKKIYTLLGFLTIFSSASLAQTDTTAVEEDYSAYENMTVQEGSIKTYCTQKVLGQAPARLIGVGYEHQFGHDLTTGLETESATDDENYRFQSASVFRAEANFPVISRNSFIFSLGGIYTQTSYNFKENVSEVSHPLVRTLDASALRNFQVNATLFKPLNAKTFILAQVLGEYAGNWKASSLQPFGRTKYSAIGVIGRKPNDRKMWGLGIARTFRAGELNYIPLIMFNYSSPNLKSGTEILFPAYAYYRYNLSAQSILRVGMELEGTSFNLRNVSDVTILPVQHPLELRRSEIKLKAMWDVPLKNFWRTQIALGYRIMYRYNVDQEVNGKEMLRLFGILSDAPYFFENKVGSAVTAGVIFNLVSP